MDAKAQQIASEYSDLITFRPDVGAAGRFVLRNGIPVNMIFDFMAEGFSPEEIAERMHLSREEVRRVHAFINDLL